MTHHPFQRLRRSIVSALLVTAIVATSAAPFQAARVSAEDPPAQTPATTAQNAPTTGDSTRDASGGSGVAGATSGGTSTGSSTTTSSGGDAGAAGGGSTTTNSASSSGSSGAATGGTGGTASSGSSTSGNSSAVQTSTEAGANLEMTAPAGAVTNSNSTQQGTGGGSSSTGAASAAPQTNSATGTGGSGAAGTTTSGFATAFSGDATAIGNMSTTEIVQMVLAIVNIVMPGVDPASITAPLVSITQNANVANIGNATANTGGNNAMVSVLSSIAGQAGLTTTQLAGLVSGQASSASGDATAVGNVSWTEIMQLVSVVVNVNGDSSLTSQLTNIVQNASVSNQGTAAADAGGNTSAVTIGNAMTNGTPSGGAASTAGGTQEDVPDDGTNSHHPVLLWGQASGKDMLVWIYVDGKMCKAAETMADPDYPGRFIWEAKVAPRECGAYRGAKIHFIVVSPTLQSITWDNLKRESPEIRLSIAGGGSGQALKAR